MEKDIDFYDFLAEIEEEDDLFNEEVEEASKLIALEEAQSNSSFQETAENLELEALYGEDAWREMQGRTIAYGEHIAKERHKRALEGTRLRKAKTQEDRLRIQRMAFDQTEVRLDAIVESYNIKRLIALLVEKHTEIIDRCSDFINRRLAALLKIYIPKKLCNCFKEYPDSMKQSPGFIYKTSPDSGEILTFWATPDIPYYFIQNTECTFLREKRPDSLKSIDRAIKLYTKQKLERSKKELNYASRILRNSPMTYIGLLKLNPFWFELLYNALKNDRQNENISVSE